MRCYNTSSESFLNTLNSQFFSILLLYSMNETDAIRDRRVTTYNERHSASNMRRGRPGSNIRGVSNLGTANNSLGGG